MKRKNDTQRLNHEQRAKVDRQKSALLATAATILARWQNDSSKLYENAFKTGDRQEIAQAAVLSKIALHKAMLLVVAAAVAAQKRLVESASSTALAYIQTELTASLPSIVNDVVVGAGLSGPIPMPSGDIVALPWYEAADGRIQALLRKYAAQVEQLLFDSIHVSVVPVDMQEVVNHAATSRFEASRILRTELVDSYREAMLMAMNDNSGLVEGWIWEARLWTCCGSCFEMHGTFHTDDETMDSHPHCECIMYPTAVPWSELGDYSDFAEFTGIDHAAEKRAMLASMSEQDFIDRFGKAKGAALYSGKISMKDLVDERFSPQWGRMRREASLQQALLNAGEE